MTEDNDVPIIAESKGFYQPSQQMLAIKREIMTYAGGHAHFLERIEEQEQLIMEQQNKIHEMANELAQSKDRNYSLRAQIYGEKFLLANCKYRTTEGLLEKIERLNLEIKNLKKEL